jgi:hypothetical protein
MPLGFRGQIEDPESLHSDIVDETVAALNDSSVMEDSGNFGRGGYTVSIIEEHGARGGSGGAELVISDLRSGRDVPAAGGMPTNLPSWEEAWAYLQKNGFTPNAEGARTLYPGEIARVGVTTVEEDGGRTTKIYDSRVGDFVTVKTRD